MLKNRVLVGLVVLGITSLYPASALFATGYDAAYPVTTFLGSWTFDSGGNCTSQGWTSVDMTWQDPGGFPDAAGFRVEDFVGMGPNYQGNIVALSGTRSMWCGARAMTFNPYGGYAALPGYGNNWNRLFGTGNCVNTGNGAVISFKADWDTEPGYDATTLEVSNCTGGVNDEVWIAIAGGVGAWDGNLDDYSTDGDTSFVIAIPDSLHEGGALKIRFHFVSDGAWSDEDGLWDTDGGFAIDDLSLSGLNGGAYEDFEGEERGRTATSDGAWVGSSHPGYGDFAGLFSGVGVLQEIRNPSLTNPTCVWGFFSGSTADYYCGGYPAQLVVPYMNVQGQYIDNEIWSPLIPLFGSGTSFQLQFDVYQDLPFVNGVFYTWGVRSIDAGGTPSPWRSSNALLFGDDKKWFRAVQEIGPYIELDAAWIQVSLGVVDGIQWGYGEGSCHSHAPLFDNVTVLRRETLGPIWSVRDVDLFQDTFPTDGTKTGTGRADMAGDVRPSYSPTIHPGDSIVVTSLDPEVGLATDPTFGGAAVYCSVALQPPDQSGKTPIDMEGYDAANGGRRWPYVGTTVVDGVSWYTFRMDTCFVLTDRRAPVANKYCFDLNDNLFTAGDTIRYFFSAANLYGFSTSWSETMHARFAFDSVAAQSMEFQILPGGGYARGGDILYVDVCDENDAQGFFDSAFDLMNIKDMVDRYDVRGASSRVGNRPGSRVRDVFEQLLPCYRKIIWSTGSLDNGLIGDGSSTGEKSDDAGMLFTFLDNLAVPGGVYFTGDNIAEEWPSLVGSAVALQGTFIRHQLVSPDHLVLFGEVNPLVIGEPGGCFAHVTTGPDTLIAFGGGQYFNDFDVIGPLGPATQEMRYNSGAPGSDGAVVAQYTSNSATTTVGVILEGFSFHYISDLGRPVAVPARAEHMQDVLVWLGNQPPAPVAAGPTYRNALSQNYPNPFNPQTSIEFTVKELAPVNVKIYNVRGQLVKTLANDRFAPGVTHTLRWDGRNDAGQQVSSGVYFCKLVTNNFTQTRKLVLLK